METTGTGTPSVATALAYTSEQVEEALRTATPAGLHPAVIGAAEAGVFTILDLFDTLPWFKTGADWTAWRAFLAALYGLPMSKAELVVYRECTGRDMAPSEPSTEAWLAVGRRGRKSAIAALVGLWCAAYRRDYGPLIAPGETATVTILSKDKYTAGQIRDYVKAMLSDPRMAYLLDSKPTGDVVPLRVPARSGTYRVDMIIRAATIGSVRSRTVLAALLDEVAFFRSDESANPDKEIIRGLKPGMTTIPGALLLGLSSPYARRGVLWERYQEYWAKPGPVLFWKAPTLQMHDTPQVRQVVADAYDEDAISAKAEYGAEFRTDVEVYVNHEVVNAVTVEGRTHLPYQPGVTYYAFVDAAGGTGDDFTWAVAHYDGAKAVLDLLGEQSPPFDPGDVIERVAEEMAPYKVRRVVGDHWSGEWPTAMFKRAGLVYYANAEPKSDIYRDLLPAMNAREVELLDSKKLRQQLVGLDRRTARGGRDSIDHAPGAHDDVANAAAGALLLAYKANRKPIHVEPPAETTNEIVRRQIAAMVWKKPQQSVNPFAGARGRR